MNVRWLDRKDIDDRRWDLCVDRDPSGLLYPKTGYLDLACDGQWSGMVMDSYEAVMALPYNRKIPGYPQIYTPFFCQQLGVYGAVEKTRELVAAFFAAIPYNFQKIHLQLKGDNRIPGLVKVQRRTNLILPLVDPIDEIREHYENVLDKNLRRARNNSLEYRVSVAFEDLEQLFRTHYWPRAGGLKSWGFKRFRHFVLRVLEEEWGQLHSVFNEEGTLLAGGVLLIYNDRTINAVTATTEEGRKACATHFMLDNAIAERAGVTDGLFDFEGSEIKGVADFYRQFGAREETYYLYEENKLPGWINDLVELKRRWGM